MLFFFVALAESVTDAIGLIAAVMVLEIAREIRAWQRGKRLRDVERDIHRCLFNHPTKPRKSRTKTGRVAGSPSHGPN